MAMKYKKNILLFLLSFIIIFVNNVYSVEYDIYAKVESKRKGNITTLVFQKKPSAKSYHIIENMVIIGKIKVVSIRDICSGDVKIYKVIAEYDIKKGMNRLLKAGSTVGLIKIREGEKRDFAEMKYKERINYKKRITTSKDKREMVLVPGGKFVFGSDSGDRDESPERVIILDDFYIDKYEVSNFDYLTFMNDANSKAPGSWECGKYNDNEEDFPVLVSYYEALAYVKWAGKRLPTEEEWEKAARGYGIKIVKKEDESFFPKRKPIIYPWGNVFNPEYVNSKIFWGSEKIGKNIKKKYKKGLLPITFSEGLGDSPYGAVNMCGNASEWTTSWYQAYPGNIYSNDRYGKQVKVIRGGAWFSDKYRIRASNREIGGVPNLYNDNIIGFRCVKSTTILERK